MRLTKIAGIGIVLALVSIGGCKAKPSDPPAQATEPRRGYTEAYTGVRSIPPSEVCMHLANMAAAEAGVSEPQFDPQLIAECERELAVEAAARGSENWNGMATCVLEARSGPDLDACNRDHPVPELTAPEPSGADSRERLVCDHLVELLLLETAAESGEVPMLSGEERQELVGECVATLLEERRPIVSPADYDALLACLIDARSSRHIQSCEAGI